MYIDSNSIANKQPSLISVETTHQSPIQRKVYNVSLGIFLSGCFVLLSCLFNFRYPLAITTCLLICTSFLLQAASEIHSLRIKQNVFLAAKSNHTFREIVKRMPRKLSSQNFTQLEKLANLSPLQRAHLLCRSQNFLHHSETGIGFSIQQGAALIRVPLGKGVCKKAFAAINLQTFTLQAHLVAKITNASLLNKIQEEIEIQNRLKGTEFVKIISCCQFLSHAKQAPKVGILMEYCDMTLHKFMKDIYTKESLKQKIRYLLAILESLLKGLLKMETLKIHHRDIKPKNILLVFSKDKIQAKIGDFGGAIEIKKEKLSPNFFYTMMFVPPEVLKTEYLIRSLDKPGVIKQMMKQMDYAKDMIVDKNMRTALFVQKMLARSATTKGDIWSMGVILFKMITYHHFSSPQLYKTFKIHLRNLTQNDVRHRFEDFQIIDDGLKVFFELCKFMLIVDPVNRPSARQCLDLFLELKQKLLSSATG